MDFQRYAGSDKVGFQPPAPLAGEFDFDQLIREFLAIMRRQVRLIASVGLAFGFLAIVYLAMRPLEYRSTVSVLIDPARVNVLQSQQVLAPPSMVDSGMVDSQVEILKSDIVAQMLVTRLKLGDDREFNRQSLLRSLAAPIIQLLFDSAEKSPEQVERDTVDNVQRKLKVERAGTSYIINIDFTSLDPEKSALIANAFADVFLELQINSRMDAARRASRWLQDRSDELRSRVIKAEEALLAYKNQHGLVEAGGRLLIEQQITDMSAQIPILRAQSAESLVKVNQIGAMLNSGDLDGSGALDVVGESVIGRLRIQSSELSRREKELEQRFGATHRLVQDARSELRSVRRQLEEEFRKLLEAQRTTYAIAQQKVAASGAALETMLLEYAKVRDKEILMRELQRDANSVRQLFETFLNRRQEMVQQESLPLMDGRVVAPAMRPTKPSSPRMLVVFVVALGAGFMVGTCLALVRDRFDNAVRRIGDVESIVGRSVLTVLEDLDGAEVLPPSGGPGTRLQLEAGKTALGLIRPRASLLRYVVLSPFSAFAESFRSLRVSLMLNGGDNPPRVVGIASTIPGEGKSTVASNLAQHLANSGINVLLVDADVRNPSLSAELYPGVTRGLPEVLLGKTSWREAIMVDPLTGLSVLPCTLHRSNERVAELLASARAIELIAELSEAFDMVVIDLAPLSGTTDARALSPAIDSFLYVVSWGRVHRGMLDRQLADAPEVKEKIVGAVLNRAEKKRFYLFEAYGLTGSYGYGYGYGAPHSRKASRVQDRA